MAKKKAHGNAHPDRERALKIVLAEPGIKLAGFVKHFHGHPTNRLRHWFGWARTEAKRRRMDSPQDAAQEPAVPSPLDLPPGEARLVAEIRQVERSMASMEANGVWTAYATQSALKHRMMKELAELQSSSKEGAPTTLEEYVAHVVRFVQIVPGLRPALLDALTPSIS